MSLNTVQVVLSILQMLLSFGNVCIMVYAFSKFLSKPHDTLEERVSSTESRIKDIENSLKFGNTRFQDQDVANEVTQRALLALIDKEIKDSVSDGKGVPTELQTARDDLYNYLFKK